LFPSPDDRLAIEEWLTGALEDARAAVKAGPVRPAIDPGQIARDMQHFDFEQSRDIGDVLRWVLPRMVDGIVHVSHPRYLGLFNPAPSFPAQCAERVAAAFNPQLATATTSPFPVAIESMVIRALARRAGMPESSTGHFTSGGSEANATALICALTRASPDFGRDGCRAFAGRPMMYTSSDAHLAWLKIAHQVGIGRSAVRLIATDGAGRMNAAALSAAIESDLAAGYVPVLIASTAGTTGGGMVDPLKTCGAIAQSCGAWHHVDAAWAGALLCSDRLRPVLDGIELADSVTIDAHKFLATTMGCGMFMTPHGGVLSDAFHVTMDCMPSNLTGTDPYVTTAQWSRRFLGLRLFLALAVAGWEGYGAHVEHAIAATELLAEKLSAVGWRRANRSQCGVLCMRPPIGAAPVPVIAAAVVASGKAWISAVMFEGESVIRACVTSGETSDADIDQVAEALHLHCWG
jgi:aromatic-L-amino-acid decarboxylase